MSFAPNVWNQLKNLTADDLISSLKKDSWTKDETRGAILVFRSGDGKKRVGIHYHPKKTYGAKLLRNLLDDIGWSEDDMRRLKLIK